MGELALGGTWLSAQGFGDARELMIQSLDLGFTGVVPAPGGRPFPWESLAPELDDLPIRVTAIRVESLYDRAEGSLGSSRVEDVARVRERVARAAHLGRVLQASTLILEAPRVALSGKPAGDSDLADPSHEWTEDRYLAFRARLQSQKNRYLETICRNLFELAGELGEFQICLTESADLSSASEPNDLEVVMSELASHKVGYWHRPALVARRASFGGPSLGDGIELLSRFLVGTDLSDFDTDGLQALPGSGGVDYGVIAPYMRSFRTAVPAVLELNPAIPAPDLRHARGYLLRFGL